MLIWLRGFGVVALAVVTTLAISACGSDTPAAPSPGRSVPIGEWADYITVPRVDYTCVSDLEMEVMGVQVHSMSTSTVTEVTEAADRTRVVVSTTILTEAPGVPAQTVVQTQTYEMLADGTVIAPAATLTGVEAEGTGSVTYPALGTLSRGQRMQSSMTVTMPIPAGAESMLTPVLNPGDASLTMRMDFETEFTPDAGPVSTEMGTFTDVVAVRMEFKGAELLNAAPGRSAEAAAVADGLVTLFPENTTWYARGVGVVRSVATTPVTGEIITDTDSCTG